MSRSAWEKKLKDAGAQEEGATHFMRASLRARATQTSSSGRSPRSGSEPESVLSLHLKANSVAGWFQQYQFLQSRRWRLDFAFPSKRLAIEIEGAVYGKVIRFQHDAAASVMYGGRPGATVRYRKDQKVTLAGGSHTRGEGFEKDILKYNTLTMLGWHLLRFTPSMVSDGHAVQTIIRALGVLPDVVTDQPAADLFMEGGDYVGESEEIGEEEVGDQATESTAGILTFDCAMP